MKKIYGTGNFNPRSFDKRPKRSGARMYLWGLAFFLFAVIAVILGGLYLFGRIPDSFTGDRIIFAIQGNKTPKTAVGEEYELTVTNNEEIALEGLELFIDWSDSESKALGAAVHFMSSESTPTSEANNTWDLGNLGVGEQISFKFTSRFVGSSEQEVSLPFTLIYKPLGFGSTFTSQYTEQFVLGDPTISIDIISPDVVADGTGIDFTIQVSGDSLENENVDELKLVIDAPSSLSITSYDPETAEDSIDEWVLSALPENGGIYELKLKGTIEGAVSSKHTFKAQLIRDSGTELLSTEKELIIQSADATLSITTDPAQGKKLQWGERLDYSIDIENTGSYVMRDAVVSVSLPEDSLWQSDSLNIQNGGFFEGGNVFWDTTTTSKLDSIRPDGSTTLAFSLSTRAKPPKGFVGSPTLIVSGSATSKLGDQDVTVESGNISVNILADVEFDTTGWHTSAEGITWGSGPNPPQAGLETTYAIIWKLGPTTSSLKDLEFKAQLPSRVSWKNDTNLSIGEISYDSSEKMVIWKASRIPALELPTEIRFMIGITPSSSLGNSSILLEQTSLVVVDAAADEELEFFRNSVTLGDIE
jgi:hypothetical protein